MRWFFIFSALVVTLAATPLDRKALLDAIGMVETGGQPRLGRHFETGIYQMTPAVRRQVGGDDKEAALKWLDIIIRRYEAVGIDPNPWSLAIAWNAGPNALLKGYVPWSTYEYANRVTALYQSYTLVIPVAPQTPHVPSMSPHMFTFNTQVRPRFVIP